MAIENLDLSNQHDQNNNVPVVINAGTALEANQILIANMQKIRHPLMDCEMVLYGFIGEVSSDVIFDENEVDGLTIRFKNEIVMDYKASQYFKDSSRPENTDLSLFSIRSIKYYIGSS